jgi:hypothetical protein
MSLRPGASDKARFQVSPRIYQQELRTGAYDPVVKAPMSCVGYVPMR